MLVVPSCRSRNLSSSRLAAVLPSFFSRFKLLESPSASGLADTPSGDGGGFPASRYTGGALEARLRGYGNVVRYCKDLYERTRIPAWTLDAPWISRVLSMYWGPTLR